MHYPVIIFLGGLTLFILLMVRWRVGRARKYLNSWAEENGYEVGAAESRLLFKGPYFLNSSKHQIVFRITVADSHGEVSNGWARCGSFWLGVLDRVDVTWDSGKRTNWQMAPRRDNVPREFSVKKPTHWLWRTKLTREQVLERLDAMQIDEDWLICPLGEATRAITVAEFVSAPDAFGAKS